MLIDSIKLTSFVWNKIIRKVICWDILRKQEIRNHITDQEFVLHDYLMKSYTSIFSTLIIFSNFVLFSLNKIVLVKKYWSVEISKLVRMTRVLSGFITIRACLRRRETLFSGVYGGARGSSYVRWEIMCLCWIRYDRYNLPLGKRHL